MLKLTEVRKWLRGKAPNRILAQRIFKCTVNSTIAFILCLVPSVRDAVGGEPAMLPLISVIVHPGRRLGTMLESTVFCCGGLLLGNAYALFGRFIGQCILGDMKDLPDDQQLTMNYGRYRAALSVLAVFQVLMLFYHGWMRVISHKFFAIVFPVFLVVHFAFTDNLNTSAGTIAMNYTVPFFLGISISLACNLLIFPEFGSSYLGRSMIDALNEFHDTMDATIHFFNYSSRSYNQEPISLAQLVKKKATLRSTLNSTQSVLQECSYEMSYSFLAPAQLKGLINTLKTQLSFSNALINASQLEHTTMMKDTKDEKFQKFLERSQAPLFELHKILSECIYIIKLGLCHSYDVKKFRVFKSSCIILSDIDVSAVNFDSKINELAKALAVLDISFREEFQTLSSEFEDYLKPNDNMFFLSSFLMNLKESTNSVCNMLKEAKFIFQARMDRESKGYLGKRIWVPFLKSTEDMRGWFEANNGDLMNANESASLNGDHKGRIYLGEHTHRNSIIEPTQNEYSLDGLATPPKALNYEQWIISVVNFYNSHKAHVRFGLQCSVGLTLATFPMFVPESRQWFVDIRGPWIGFVCILVLEPEVGSTFFVFFLRGVGVISGAAWGYLSYVSGIHQTNPYLETVITVIGAVPGFYYFLGTPYIKAAIIGIISIYIVLLSTALPSEAGGSILVNFGKRCLAMIYGGAVALLCQLCFFPNKARDELNREIVFSTNNLSQLLLLYAAGLEGGDIKESMSEKRFSTFQKLSLETKASLIRADAYRLSAKKEPRLKGNYNDIEKIFYEITFILREILDRLDNIVQLRRAYGSAIIEEFNREVHPYRRQLLASMNNAVKAVEFAFSTKSPLPQYLPSPSIAHQRLLQKVTELVQLKYPTRIYPESTSGSDSESEVIISFRDRRSDKEAEVQKRSLLKEKFLSWNASSAATEEVIQYIEELLILTRVLVGVNEFKYGFLSRSLFSEYADNATKGFQRAMAPLVDDSQEDDEDEEGTVHQADLNPVALDESSAQAGISHGFRSRVYSIGSWIRGDETQSMTSLGDLYDTTGASGSDDALPASLMRVVSKKSEGK